MGYAEEAQVQLAKAKKTGDPATLAAAYASLAVMESVDALASQVAYLSDLLEDDKQTRSGKVH